MCAAGPCKQGYSWGCYDVLQVRRVTGSCWAGLCCKLGNGRLGDGKCGCHTVIWPRSMIGLCCGRLLLLHKEQSFVAGKAVHGVAVMLLWCLAGQRCWRGMYCRNENDLFWNGLF